MEMSRYFVLTQKIEFRMHCPNMNAIDHDLEISATVTIKLHCKIYLASTIPCKQLSRLTGLSDLPILPLLAFYVLCL